MPNSKKNKTEDDNAFKAIMASTSIKEFIDAMNLYGCQRCTLSQHDNRIVICRGRLTADIMMIGEAPGKIEDQQGLPFVGPAGMLGDRMFASIGINTNHDMYITNVCLCRPVAPRGSGKQNYTPLMEQRALCLPYQIKQISLLDPKLIILAGLTAARAFLGTKMVQTMKQAAGKLFLPENGPLAGRHTFVLYHPAFLIHAKKKGEEIYKQIRQDTWKHLQILRDKIEELDIEVSGTRHICSVCNEGFISRRPYFVEGRPVCASCGKRSHVINEYL